MRIEAKYHLDRSTASFLQVELQASGFALDEHCEDGEPYTVSSIYLDSHSFDSYAEKEAGLTRRTKYRLRFYAEELAAQTPIHLEHKEKDSHLTWKRTRPLSYQEVGLFLTEGRGPVLDHLDPEAGYLEAAICIAYERLAFRHPVYDARLTFDSRLRWRGLEPARPGFLSEARHEPLREDQLILEIKVPQEQARDIADLVHRWNLHWRETSKYAICLSHMMRCLLDEPFQLR